MESNNTMFGYFARAARAGVRVELHIDHPRQDYEQQSGVCYEAHQDYCVIGPEGAPARVCIPYHAIRWFRRSDDQV